MLVPLIKIKFHLLSSPRIIQHEHQDYLYVHLVIKHYFQATENPHGVIIHVGFFVLPSSSFHMSFMHNVFLHCSLWNFPNSANPHCFDLPGLQKFIGGVHTAVQHISNFFRGYQGVIVIKHNGQSSFDGLLYCCRMSNHTRYRERATTQVIALFCA